jgi:hypothetical protein
MRFATVVAGVWRVSRLLRPFKDRQLCVAAVNRDPSDRPVALLPTNLTPINRVNHQKTSTPFKFFPKASQRICLETLN